MPFPIRVCVVCEEEFELKPDKPGFANRCPQCSETLIERHGYLIKNYRLTPDGHCPKCAAAIPGRWSTHFEGQIAAHPFLPRKRASLFTIQSH